MPSANKYLATYLNDHLGGSTTGIELVKRIAGENEGNELGRFCSELVPEIDADRVTLQELMSTLGVKEDRIKVAAGWTAEKAGRLKPNAEFRGYSPLSPLVELEGLSLGIEGKRSLWLALSQAELVAQQLGAERLQELIARADSQRERVELHRREAARRAFTA